MQIASTLVIASTLAVKGVLETLRPQLEAAAGGPVAITFDPTAVLAQRIRDGLRADLAILTAEGIEQLGALGILALSTRADLARSLVGIAVRAGAPKPDISSIAALRQTLLAAPSLVYSRGGASGIFFVRLIERLGLAAELGSKATVIPSGFTAELVARGDAALAVQQISELMAVAGVDIVGPLPEGAQESLLFAGATFTSTQRMEAAKAVLAVLADPARAGLYEAKGLMPVA